MEEAGMHTCILLAEMEKSGRAFNKDLVAPRTIREGTLELPDSGLWTSSFSGALWFLYECSNGYLQLGAARKHTTFLEKEQFDTSIYEQGFMLYCSYENPYRLTRREEYRKVIIQAAQTPSQMVSFGAGVSRSRDETAANNLWRMKLNLERRV